MYTYSAPIELPGGVPLGGYGQRRLAATASQSLMVNGIGLEAPVRGDPFELCALDALYAGDLCRAAPRAGCRRIFAASHTHSAPMLDSNKPAIGAVDDRAVSAFASAIVGAPRTQIAPEHCAVYRADVALPVYRRFDRPDSALNRALTRHAGLYPNETVAIDRGLYLFVFSAAGRTQFTIAYHACHPVTRSDVGEVSPDYVQALRQAVAERFATPYCLFLQGCAGDVRPNFARKRIDGLPRSRLNWRFAYPPSGAQQLAADKDYERAVRGAGFQRSFDAAPGAFVCRRLTITIDGAGDVEVTELRIADAVVFRFVPFELSHHYHLQARELDDRVFLVSCADDVHGYLPHPSQLDFGGYEVDGSRRCMGLARRVTGRDPRLWRYA